MRIGIAHQDHQILNLLRKVIGRHKDLCVAWTATCSDAVLRHISGEFVDVVLLDIDLPMAGGVKITESIMQNDPCQIIIMTFSINDRSALIFKAMGYGAVDTLEVNPDDLINCQFETLVLKKINKAGLLKRPAILSSTAALAPVLSATTPVSCNNKGHLVAIGASTGGPKTLAQVLAGLPANIPAAIVIIQHVVAEFSDNLAKWLAKQIKLQVKLAKEGDAPRQGIVYVACTNDHLVMTRKGRFAYTSEPANIHYRPSVDVFFQSLSKHWQTRELAIILTGMGNDGAKGMKELRTKGWHTIAQDQATSSVYGMPKAAVSMDAAVESLPADAITPAIIKFLSAFMPS